jgi:hypothetical protein
MFRLNHGPRPDMVGAVVGLGTGFTRLEEFVERSSAPSGGSRKVPA